MSETFQTFFRVLGIPEVVVVMAIEGVCTSICGGPAGTRWFSGQNWFHDSKAHDDDLN